MPDNPQTEKVSVDIQPDDLNEWLKSMKDAGWRVTKQDDGTILLTDANGQEIKLTPEPNA